MQLWGGGECVKLTLTFFQQSANCWHRIVYTTSESAHLNADGPSSQAFPEVYQSLVDDGLRGNFIASCGRSNDVELGRTFSRFWAESPHSDFFKTVSLESGYTGRPQDYPEDVYAEMATFFLSDHFSFWSVGEPGDDGLKAVMLTDSGLRKI